ncbi:Retrovirus-related Pol polyprotein from transposon TNT 1-94 [Senna tora]|uniref:Retrovirus-related Pol polyprotein from transposon TNT 1-94 n=1 Tax=Senna tora TaxID=362788 RepID=A0A834XC96_9FABA|nr:Retrovirus-related Pol polyprotein from transposon TNT 1-94 [Senna tora]
MFVTVYVVVIDVVHQRPLVEDIASVTYSLTTVEGCRSYRPVEPAFSFEEVDILLEDYVGSRIPDLVGLENFVQPAVPRFDGHYDHWSMLMENFLRSKEYWPVVEGGIRKATVGVTLTDALKTEIEAQKLKDLKAKNYLFQAIDRTILETILCKDTSKQIQDSMKKKYQVQQDKEEHALQAITTSKDSGHGRNKWKGKNSNRVEDGNKKKNACDQKSNGKSKSADKSHIECFRCHRYGHYRSECRTNLNKHGGGKSNFAETSEKEEEVSLLMVCNTQQDTHKSLWYLDTGCSIHMCGIKSAFSELDETFSSTVKFDLKTNLLSVGQLQEKGYEILMMRSIMSNQQFNLQSKLKEGVNDLNESEKDQHGWMIMRSEDQTTDIFTKPLKVESFVKLRKLLGVFTLKESLNKVA